MTNSVSTSTYALAGHQVGRVGYGAMQLPGPGVFGPPRDHDEAIRVLKRTRELGINHIDTSQFYGPNVSNELIHEALHPYGEELVLVSKVGAYRDEKGGWLPAQHPQQLKDAVHENLKTLGVERLAAVNLRVMPREEMSDDSLYCPFEEQVAAMKELVAEGSLEAFGASNVSREQAEYAIKEGATCIQNAFNLLMQDDAATVEVAAKAGIAYVPFFPLGSAFEHMPKVTDNEVVRKIAQARNITPAQVGLSWLLAYSPNILLIPGTSSVAHLDENTAVRDITLTSDEVEELNRIK